ncbi:GlxA family transcriptional regulator [Kribbella sp. NPDC002412]
MATKLTVAVLDLPRVIPIDFSIPSYLFGGCPGYQVVAAAADADIIVVPGYDDPEEPLPTPYLDLLAGSSARIVAVCTGAFAVADAGLLDGRDATTHWQYVAPLRRLHPRINVLENKLFVEDGKILTSAGGGATIDACLHVIRTDLGETAAYEAGKGIVAAPVRGGDQQQYVDLRTPPRSDLSATRAWALEHLGEPLTVQRMAAHATMPRRTFIRHFENETGVPPMRWVVEQRLLSARRLLETSDWTIERIASAAGFGTASTFRETFRREVGTTPSAYRQAARD